MKISFKEITTLSDDITIFDGKDRILLNHKNYGRALFTKNAIPISSECHDLNELRVFSGPNEFKVKFTKEQQDKVSDGRIRVDSMKTTEYANYNFEKNKNYKITLNITNMNNLGMLNSEGQLVSDNTPAKPMTSIIKENPNIKSIVLEEGITEIPEMAFYNCGNIETVIIPDTVTTIGSAAFLGCASLKNLFIPDGVTVLDGVLFANCQNLETVYLPAHIKEISSNLFSSCPSLVEVVIPNEIETIGAASFIFCGKLSKISIPKSVKLIEVDAFRFCRNLKEIPYGGTIADWKKITIEAGAFEGKIIIHCTDGDLHI